MAKNWHSTIWNKNIEDIMSDSFGKYAKYIIQDRALPDVRDGLKPVQRRILYAMNDLNLLHDKPYKKSARTVGEVIGKYHPHGDLSIYEAMVRMSQDWKSNAPLLDMHGNNGSIDGDSAAAMRYTESRLSLFGETLLNDIKKDTVDFIPNFDDSEKEPTVLPTLLPNLLINGSSGIAAGYATNIPPFNVQEVIDAVILKIDSPNCQLGSILKVMPGPDFPTGGTILNQEGIVEAYKTGRGKIIIRGDIKEEKKQLIITSIPFETSKANIVKAIDEIRIKNDNLGIVEVRDESSKEGLSIAIDLKTGANTELIKKFLYKNTQLQISYNFNMVAIVNNKPVLMPMDLILESFVNHLQTIVVRASQFDLNKAKKRLNIVNGLIKAISILDDVIETIRFSTGKAEAKNNLIDKYAFNEEQAEAIVNLRLYRLSLTDVKQFREEAKQLEEDIIRLETLIENTSARNNHIKAKLRELKKTFKAERKSKFSSDEAKIDINVNDMIENKEEMVVVTKDGYIKTISNKNYMAQQYQDLKLKELDLPIAQFIANKRDKLVLITNKGNYIVIPCHKVNNTKWKEIGIHYNNIISAHTNEIIVNAFAYNQNNSNKQLLLATSNGNIKRITIEDLNVASSAKISTCMALTSDDDRLITCEIINNEEDNIIAISNNGYSLSYPLKAIPLVSRKAQGVKAFNIKDDDKLIGAIIDNNEIDLLALIGPNGGKRIRKSFVKKSMTRNSVGSLLINQTKHNTIKVSAVFEAKVSDLFNIVDESKQWSIIKSTTIPMGDDSSRLSNFWKYQILSTSRCYLKGREEIVNEENQGEVKSLFE